MAARNNRDRRSLFRYPSAERLLSLHARRGPMSYADICCTLGSHKSPTINFVRRLVRIGALHAEMINPRKVLVGFDRAALGSDALRDLINALAPPSADAHVPARRNHQPSFPDLSRERNAPRPMDLDGLMGSVIGGRALLLIRALGGADGVEIADLLARRDEDAVWLALKPFVEVGAIRLGPKSGLRRPYVLASEWAGANALRRLLDLHLAAMPDLRRRATLSRRAVGGRRGPAAPRTSPTPAPRGLNGAPFFAPFIPPTQAKLVLLMAKRGPIGGTDIAATLRIQEPPANGLGRALAKRGLATTAVSLRGSGGERWYSLTPAGALLGQYLASLCSRVPTARQTRVAPPFPEVEPRPWRECAALPHNPQRIIVEILDALIARPQGLHALATALGKRAPKVARQIDKLVRAGIVRVTFPANVLTYAFDTRTKQGRAALALFSTP